MRRLRVGVRFALAGLIVAAAVFASASVTVGAGQAAVITRFGGLSRVLERGTRGITFTLDFMLFTIIPTIIEILLVAAILWGMFDASFALATLGTIGVYVAFTLLFTDWRLRFRREMNATDQEANTKAIDSLLNYETVKYFNGEQHELGRYRDAINQYQLLEYRVMGALNLLNLVQNFIIVRIFLTSLLSDIY